MSDLPNGHANGHPLSYSYTATKRIAPPSKMGDSPTASSSSASSSSNNHVKLYKLRGLKPHPSSVLSYLKMKPKYMVYVDVLKTNSNWMRVCTPVEEDWLQQ